MNAKDIIEILQKLGFPTITAILLLFIVLVALLFWEMVKPALVKKAENFAQLEDLSKLTEKVKEVESRFNAELEAIKKEHQKEIEEYRALLEQRKLVGRLQYEKEFEIYSKLWESFAELEFGILQIRSIFDPIQKPSESALLERIEFLALANKNFYRIVQTNKPFFDKQVYEAMRKFQARGAYELLKLRPANQPNLDSYEDKAKYMKQIDEEQQVIKEASEAISEAIRNRISSMEVALGTFRHEQ